MSLWLNTHIHHIIGYATGAGLIIERFWERFWKIEEFIEKRHGPTERRNHMLSIIEIEKAVVAAPALVQSLIKILNDIQPLLKDLEDVSSQIKALSLNTPPVPPVV